MIGMKRMAEFVLPYRKTDEDEADLSILKTRTFVVDGYEITFYLNKEQGDDYDIWSLQMYSKYQPFLPFHLVCKCVSAFFGTRDLALTEFVLLGRKVYVWSVAVDRDGTPIPIPSRPDVEARTYEGVSFCKASPKRVLLLPS